MTTIDERIAERRRKWRAMSNADYRKRLEELQALAEAGTITREQFSERDYLMLYGKPQVPRRIATATISMSYGFPKIEKMEIKPWPSPHSP